MLTDLKEVRFLLGRNFDAIWNFFKILNSREFLSKYGYSKIIHITRRCLLVNVILRRFMPDDGSLCDYSVIISDTELDKECVTSKNLSKVLIVDDIVIHGRHIHEIYDTLLERGIKADLAACRTGADADLNFKESPVMHGFVCANELEWHELSNSLVDLIIKSEIPYATFIHSFTQKNSKKIDKVFNSGKYEKYVTSDINPKNNFSMYRDAAPDDFALLKQLNSCLAARRYKDNTYVVMPFVMIPSLSNKNADEILEKLSEKNAVFKTLKQNHSYKYKAILLSYTFGILYGKARFSWDRFGCVPELQDQIDSIFRYTFPEELSEWLYTCSAEDAMSILNQKLEETENFTEDLTKLDFFDVKSSNNHTVNGFISELHNKNEERSKKSKPKYKGIAVCSIPDAYSILADFISAWDCGIASFSFNSTERCAYACINDGEQSYKIQLKQYSRYLYSMFLLREHGFKFGVSLESLERDSENAKWEKYTNRIRNLGEDFSDVCEAVDYFRKQNLNGLLISELKDKMNDERLFNETETFIREVVASE